MRIDMNDPLTTFLLLTANNLFVIFWYKVWR